MLAIDRQLFEWINGDATNYFFDLVLPFLRVGTNWTPLYIVLFGYAIYKFRKKVFLWIIPLALTVGLTDSIGNYLLKKNVERPRPCHEAAEVDVRLLVSCGSGYSFTSNHASNHMGLALFLAFTLFQGSTWALVLLLLWAFVIGYAQIYVGVHYPFDILGGFLLGTLIAILGIFIHRKIFSASIFQKRDQQLSQ